MRLSPGLCFLLASLQASVSPVAGFSVGRPVLVRKDSLCLYASGEDSAPRRSRIEGNQRAPNESEVQLMDEMIAKLADAKPYELPNAVRRAFRVISSPQFFMRIAELSDKATGDEKEKLSALASNLVSTLEAVVETTEEQLDERAAEVEKVVKAAAEPGTGEFLVPLLPAQVKAMRDQLEKLEPSSLDEGFLSTVDAWMNKSHQDGMDGMVTILQKVLQMYSGLQIKKARDVVESKSSSPEGDLFDKLLLSDEESWESIIREGIANDVSASGLVTTIQKTMETVVLGLENGSMAQQVQAEYLRELVTRVEKIEAAAS